MLLFGLRPTTWSFVVACAGMALGPPGPDEKQVEKLKKAQKTLAPANSALKWLTRTAWTGAILKNSPDLARIAGGLEKIKKPVSELNSAVTKLVEATEDEKDTKALRKSFLDQLKLLTLRGQKQELEKIAKTIRMTPVGLVSERVDQDFSVSGDLLAKDPDEAERRFGEYVDAMEKNVEYLKERKSHLEEFVELADDAAGVIRSLKDGTEKAIDLGVFTKPLVEQYLDLDELELAYRKAKSDAEAVSDDIDDVIEEEESRIDNLRTSLKTLFDFDV